MSIAHMTIERESVFGKRQFVATLHALGKRICAVVGDTAPSADEMAMIEMRLLRQLAEPQRSNYVSAEGKS